MYENRHKVGVPPLWRQAEAAPTSAQVWIIAAERGESILIGVVGQTHPALELLIAAAHKGLSA